MPKRLDAKPSARLQHLRLWAELDRIRHRALRALSHAGLAALRRHSPDCSASFVGPSLAIALRDANDAPIGPLWAIRLRLTLASPSVHPILPTKPTRRVDYS